MNQLNLKHKNGFTQGLRPWLFLALLLLSTGAFANRIECEFDVNDKTPSITIYPQYDIFETPTINLPGGFRFTGQYLPDLNKFKAYIYHTPKERYVLLALQDFSLTPSICVQDFGKHRVYDSADERELYFHCKKMCAQ